MWLFFRRDETKTKKKTEKRNRRTKEQREWGKENRIVPHSFAVFLLPRGRSAKHNKKNLWWCFHGITPLFCSFGEKSIENKIKVSKKLF